MKNWAFELHDPWAGRNLLETLAQWRGLADGDRFPWGSWRLLDPDERAMLGGLVRHTLTTHGPLGSTAGKFARLDFNRARLQEALAATHTTEPTLGGYGHDLTIFFVDDDADRARWRKLHLFIQSKFTMSDIDEIIVAVDEARAMEGTLLARRDAIDAQLERGARGRAGRDAVIRERAARDHERLSSKGEPS